MFAARPGRREARGDAGRAGEGVTSPPRRRKRRRRVTVCAAGAGERREGAGGGRGHAAHYVTAHGSSATGRSFPPHPALPAGAGSLLGACRPAPARSAPPACHSGAGPAPLACHSGAGPAPALSALRPRPLTAPGAVAAIDASVPLPPSLPARQPYSRGPRELYHGRRSAQGGSRGTAPERGSRCVRHSGGIIPIALRWSYVKEKKNKIKTRHPVLILVCFPPSPAQVSRLPRFGCVRDTHRPAVNGESA